MVLVSISQPINAVCPPLPAALGGDAPVWKWEENGLLATDRMLDYFFPANFDDWLRQNLQVTTVVSPATSEARSILDRLSSVALCAIVDVCSALRDYCRNDHFWEKHMKQKWGKVIGDATDREWQ
ncbi:hypothetical protein V6N13_054665 [Hibiscus sabdariffa]